MTAPTEGFEGTIGRTLADSEPHFEERTHPKRGAPNVVIVLLDDTGFHPVDCAIHIPLALARPSPLFAVHTRI